MTTLYYDPLAYATLGVEIFIPDPVQVRSAYEKGAIAEFPYWSRVWPSSLALASWLHGNGQYLVGKKVFEVGAGLGLPSFIAAKHASSVLISDHIPLAIEWCRFNITRSQVSHASAVLFDWRTRPLPTADLVLMSDIGYNEEDFGDVIAMIRQYIDMGSVVMLTVPERRISSRFIAAIEDLVKRREIIELPDTEILLLTFGITDFLLPVQKKNS